ncbi:uncharacterized protein [Prorops nasuta]|uniref:uncharacterized protein isoform X3 n=1 Tax=Prorops nasuta TaxID=863751 RepID=UPI0034CD1755
MLEFSVQHAEVALSTAPEDVADGLQGHDNDTDSLQSLSHLDPPVDSVYMICGVLIAMVLVGVIIVLLAVTISKLRKREDHSNAVHPEPAMVQTVATTTPLPTSIVPTQVDGCCTQITQITTTSITTNNNSTSSTDLDSPCSMPDPIYATVNPADQYIWQFPPPYPPPQYTLYNDQDTLVHALPTDRSGFAKGFRKNFGGRWRRLVKRKPETETCAIPPELKDQLKTIYVY